MVFYLKYALVGISALGMTYYGWSPPGWQQWCVFSAYALFFALSLAIIDEVVRVIKVRGMTEIRGVTAMECPLCLGKGYLEVGLPVSLASTSEDFGICGHRDSATGPPRKTS